MPRAKQVGLAERRRATSLAPTGIIARAEGHWWSAPPTDLDQPGLSTAMKISDIKSAGHWPTLVASFLYFDVSFMIWTLLGPLGVQIGESLHLSAEQKGMMVAVPILAGAILRLVLGVTVDRIGAKNTGVIAQLIVI